MRWLKMFNGFLEFIQKRGVVGLAVGFILGASVAKVVTALVNDIINPVVGLALGAAGGLQSAYFWLGPAKILYGDFLSVLIDFLIVAAVVYFIVHGLGFDKLDKKD